MPQHKENKITELLTVMAGCLLTRENLLLISKVFVMSVTHGTMTIVGQIKFSINSFTRFARF